MGSSTSSDHSNDDSKLVFSSGISDHFPINLFRYHDLRCRRFPFGTFRWSLAVIAINNEIYLTSSLIFRCKRSFLLSIDRQTIMLKGFLLGNDHVAFLLPNGKGIGCLKS